MHMNRLQRPLVTVLLTSALTAPLLPSVTNNTSGGSHFIITNALCATLPDDTLLIATGTYNKSPNISQNITRSMAAMELTPFDSQTFSYRVSTNSGLKTDFYGLKADGINWVAKGLSPEFAVGCNGELLFSSDPGFRVRHRETTELRDGGIQITIITERDQPKLLVESCYRFYRDTGVLEQWSTIRNTGDAPLEIGRFDTFCKRIPAGHYTLHSFTSGWGAEFSPVAEPLRGTKILEGIQGRSSGNTHPWMMLQRDQGGQLCSSIAWSGNWIYRFEPQADGTYLITGGINPWSFSKQLAPGQQLEGLHVVSVLSAADNPQQACLDLAAWGRGYWYPQNELSRSLPVEWNHWWPYEDEGISSATFTSNVDVAAELGVEICTLDAGWFGPADDHANWYDYRGDWSSVNRKRFPGGIREISDYVHAQGMKFGLWCEIEAVGKRAALGQQRPELVAMRDGKSLGCICLGNPDAQEWAFNILESLIQDYQCDWIKLDYNMDIGAGCNRTDHGHGSGDGLYEHYQGYYRLLDRFRAAHPQVVLENCSSGGLRTDLGIAQHTHFSFLSDQDMPVHSLQLIWGATTMLAPSACLHWSWSQTRGAFPSLDLTKYDREPERLDYYFRVGMLHAFGFSQPLPDLPVSVRTRLADNIRFYKETVRPYLASGTFYRLTEQPLRSGAGSRWCAFQFLMPGRTQALVFVFRLPGADADYTVHCMNLLPDASYNVSREQVDKIVERRTGRQLMQDGIAIRGLDEERSLIFHVKVDSQQVAPADADKPRR